MIAENEEELIKSNQNRLSSYNIITKETLQTQQLLKKSSANPAYLLLKECYTAILDDMMTGKDGDFLPLVNHKIISHFKDISQNGDKALLLKARSLKDLKICSGNLKPLTQKMVSFINYMSSIPYLTDLYVIESEGILDFWFIIKNYTSEINIEYTSMYIKFTIENEIDNYEIMIIDEEEIITEDMPKYLLHFKSNN